MRIISGRFKGRKLKTLRGANTRPTADRVRESLFNILGPETVRGAVVLDLFAGTGALGIEALSRGAELAVFIEKAKPATTVLKSNLAICALEQQTRVLQWDILKNLNCLDAYHNRFSLVFMDPPYNRGMITPTLRNLVRSRTLAEYAMVVVEHDPHESTIDMSACFAATDVRRYGKTCLTFLSYTPTNDTGNDCIGTHSMLE